MAQDEPLQFHFRYYYILYSIHQTISGFISSTICEEAIHYKKKIKHKEITGYLMLFILHTVKRLIFGGDLSWWIWRGPKNRQIK